MRIALAQIDSVIGDFDGNARRIADHAAQAAEQAAADLVVFPELALCGYPPMDLLDQDAFVEQTLAALDILARTLPRGVCVGVGFVGRNGSGNGKALVNSYALLRDGELLFTQDKTLLPSYDVFDEARYFQSASARRILEWGGERIGIAICEDLWHETALPVAGSYEVDPVADLIALGATLILVPSASPYYAYKGQTRRALVEKLATRQGCPVVYVNAVGANDSIIFDGRSFIMSPGKPGAPAELRASAAAFREDLVVWDAAHPDSAPVRLGEAEAPEPTEELDLIEEALICGIRGYMDKCGFKKAHLGLSGGIDSALVAYLAVRALGSGNVSVFGLPSRYSSQGSLDDARDLAERLGIDFGILSIEPVFEACLGTLKPQFDGLPVNLTEENLQARVRGMLLMAISNKFDSLLLTTGNKSELAMGYCTLYGDMCGGLDPIGDLFKVEVFALCRRINARALERGEVPPIPENILTKPPSAELRPNQKDSDSLPEYEVLDEVLQLYLIDKLSKAQIVARGWDEALVDRVIRACARAEFKRRQAAPVLKVSPKAFGMGRRIPIARAVHENR